MSDAQVIEPGQLNQRVWEGSWGARGGDDTRQFFSKIPPMNSVCSKVCELLDNFASQENVSVFLQFKYVGESYGTCFFFKTLVPPAHNLFIRLIAPCESLLGVESNFLCRISKSAGPCKVRASHVKLLLCNFPRYTVLMDIVSLISGSCLHMLFFA